MPSVGSNSTVDVTLPVANRSDAPAGVQRFAGQSPKIGERKAQHAAWVAAHDRSKALTSAAGSAIPVFCGSPSALTATMTSAARTTTGAARLHLARAITFGAGWWSFRALARFESQFAVTIGVLRNFCGNDARGRRESAKKGPGSRRTSLRLRHPSGRVLADQGPCRYHSAISCSISTLASCGAGRTPQTLSKGAGASRNPCGRPSKGIHESRAAGTPLARNLRGRKEPGESRRRNSRGARRQRSDQRFIRTVPRYGYAFRDSTGGSGRNGIASETRAARRDGIAVENEAPGRSGATAFLLLGAAIAGLWLFTFRSAPPARPIRLGVLPLQNLTGAPDQDYLCDGMTEELIAQLGAVDPARSK